MAKAIAAAKAADAQMLFIGLSLVWPVAGRFARWRSGAGRQAEARKHALGDARATAPGKGECVGERRADLRFHGLAQQASRPVLAGLHRRFRYTEAARRL